MGKHPNQQCPLLPPGPCARNWLSPSSRWLAPASGGPLVPLALKFPSPSHVTTTLFLWQRFCNLKTPSIYLLIVSPTACQRHKPGLSACSHPCPQIWRVVTSEHFLKEWRGKSISSIDYVAPSTLCVWDEQPQPSSWSPLPPPQRLMFKPPPSEP